MRNQTTTLSSTAISLPPLLPGLAALCLSLLLYPAPCQAEDQPDPEYLQVVTMRAGKIVETLGIEDTAKAVRVRDVIALQYWQLSQMHDARDQAINAARTDTADDKEAVAAAIAAAKNEADAKVYVLHAAFLARLSVELNSDQVDGVKDGMTYGVANGTYNVYMEMMPDLSEEQKRQVKAWLLEARELAMDQGSSREKHGVFGKYKGKINNYLSAAGYDLKEAEKNLRKWRSQEEAESESE
jgi:hypothetical protein